MLNSRPRPIAGSRQLGAGSLSRQFLLPLPPRDRAGVLEHDAARVEILADAIGFGEVARQPRRAPGLDQAARSPRSAPAAARLPAAGATARRAPGRTPRTSRARPPRPPALSSPASIDEFSARTRSNITPMPAAVFRSAAMCAAESVARFREPRRDLIVLRPGGQRVEPRQEVGQPLERLLGLRHRGPRELQLLPVVHAEIQVAQRRRPVALLDDVGEVEDVAERLRHLVRAAGRPPRSSGARRASRSARTCCPVAPFALRDLVLVMRKDQVDAAGVEVDRRARAGAAPSPSTRCASRDGRRRSRDPRPARRACSPSTARSRGRRPFRTCRCRRARRS